MISSLLGFRATGVGGASFLAGRPGFRAGGRRRSCLRYGPGGFRATGRSGLRDGPDRLIGLSRLIIRTATGPAGYVGSSIPSAAERS